MNREIIVYIGLGSNLGNREENLNSAIHELENTEGIEVKKISPFYNTSPVGYLEQPDFLNGVVEIETTLEPHALLGICMDIESRLRRVRDIRWGPRTIDMDILLYGDQIISDNELIIPHPRMHERYFVLKPLSDIAADLVHPVKKQTIGELYHNILLNY